MVSIIGDGAAWIRNLAAAGSPRPPASWISTRPASTCAASPGPLEFMLGDRKDEWLARLEDLDYGYIDGIAADPSHSPAQPGSEPNPDARIADGGEHRLAHRLRARVRALRVDGRILIHGQARAGPVDGSGRTEDQPPAAVADVTGTPGDQDLHIRTLAEHHDVRIFCREMMSSCGSPTADGGGPGCGCWPSAVSTTMRSQQF
jgi:hypothetical protein